MGFPELGKLVPHHNLIFEIGKFRESRLSDVEGYVRSLMASISADYTEYDVVRMGVETYARHAVEAMKTHNPKHKLRYMELAVYLGGSVASRTDDFAEGEAEKQIRSSIKADPDFKSLRK